MDRSLLDTDMLSEILKGIDRNVVAKAVAYHATFGHYTICVVTITEIVKGYHKIQREDRIRRFLAHVSNFEVLILDCKVRGFNRNDKGLLELAMPLSAPALEPMSVTQEQCIQVDGFATVYEMSSKSDYHVTLMADGLEEATKSEWSRLLSASPDDS